MWMCETAARPPLVVMIVDDEAAIRSLQRRILHEGGFSVVDVEDGQAAMKLVSGDVRPDLVVADLNMPGMDGSELAGRLRAILPAVKVLFVTGHADALFNLRSKMGVDEAYLEKPFSRAGLIEAVSLLMYGRLDS